MLEYSNERIFKVCILKLKKHTSLWFENIKTQRAKEQSHGLEHGPNSGN